MQCESKLNWRATGILLHLSMQRSSEGFLSEVLCLTNREIMLPEMLLKMD